MERGVHSRSCILGYANIQQLTEFTKKKNKKNHAHSVTDSVVIIKFYFIMKISFVQIYKNSSEKVSRCGENSSEKVWNIAF